jgi:hypothetical protein
MAQARTLGSGVPRLLVCTHSSSRGARVSDSVSIGSLAQTRVGCYRPRCRDERGSAGGGWLP